MLNGEKFIETICNRLKTENKIVYSTTIVDQIRELTEAELNQLIMLGNVVDWHNKSLEGKEAGRE